jgi:hypothetical protein
VEQTNEPVDPAALAELREFEDVCRRARKGDASTLPALRKLLANPSTVDLLGGNLAANAEQSFVRSLAGDDLAFREALTRKLELMRAELAGPDPTPVERLLVERVAACWLQVQDADARYAQGQKDLTFAQGEYYQRRQDRAHKRFLSAVRTLALVRKLAVPVLQVNIARRQVNVAGPCEAAKA